ncbi:SRPBCC family protein [Arthrobacter liuii]|uniref:Polyketide cyclase / dehydrase and lipid transport n=1 Tax=Arthrobacter liuii TaxID=1476996 RepID=A0ABQ2AGP1_9MICC|nr:SRPBCC family protein [Arthrobacter liuii]GGH91347.1 hypothetical protein GCM10007170_07290 [Arthrobacter liuii]
MVTIHGSIVIRRPVEEVFDFAADERNEPAYNPQMKSVEKITPGPVGAGTVWRTTIDQPGRAASFDVEVIDYVRPFRLESLTRTGTLDIQGALTFQAIDDGTRMDWSWDLKPKGLLKLAAPVLAAMGRRNELRIWNGFKRHLEHTAGG